ncbi:hypothetical protein KY284_000967 [Solanum tuberosum]|nr:hypothetical protein KY284_000967 [Solanum tuberosum]
MGDPLGSPRVASILFFDIRKGVVRTGDGGVEDGHDGRRHASVRVEARNGVDRTVDGGVEDGRDGRRHASVRVEARSVGGRLGRWEEGGV